MIPLQQNDLRDSIDHTFRDLMPEHGMAEREEQIALSHRMLDSMIDRGISLCDAGTGIGKTFAYLVAGIVYQRYLKSERMPFRPIIISTSSIALQNAILKDYIPFLSKLMLQDGMIDRPVRGVVRKGKQHYVCDRLLERRLRIVKMERKNKAAANALASLLKNPDMDLAKNLSAYDREHVCVPKTCNRCRRACRYLDFLKQCETRQDAFQICNHNLLLADAIRRNVRGKAILPDGCAVIIDEAHKLTEAARQMLGKTLTVEDILELERAIQYAGYLLAADSLRCMTRNLVAALNDPPEDRPFSEYKQLLVAPAQTLEVIQRQLKEELPRPVFGMLNGVNETVRALNDESRNAIRYAVEDEKGGTMLCATATNMNARLSTLLWNRRTPFLLTSATLAVGDDFSRFRKETGLAHSLRVRESVSPSPFAYEKNCLLYLPEQPAHIQERRYYDELTDQIMDLLHASHGHALVLFTSYAAMAAVTEQLSKRHCEWPVFAMSRNSAHIVERFKKTPGAVLLATGAAWEGIDFPGDCVSMLIIPRLPFPQPDTLKERERENYESLRGFIRGVVLPEMQIKLRQGFGRAIRTETDTCVVAILDERATSGGRYREDVLRALPDMPITMELEDVSGFIQTVKSAKYFMKGRQSA